MFECGQRQHVGPRGNNKFTPGGFLKPDIFDFTQQTFAEIKPLSPSGVASGKIQIALYARAFGPTGVWQHAPFVPDILWAPNPTLVDGRYVKFFNSQGVIFYTDDRRAFREIVGLSLVALKGVIRQKLKLLATKVGADAVVAAGRGIAARAAAAQARAIASSRPLAFISRF